VATLTNHVVKGSGVAHVHTSAASGGDFCTPGDHTFISVINGGGSPITVTVNSVAVDNYGTDVDLAVSVAAGATQLIGPLPASRFADPAHGGLVGWTYSSVTSVTVSAVTA